MGTKFTKKTFYWLLLVIGKTQHTCIMNHLSHHIVDNVIAKTCIYICIYIYVCIVYSLFWGISLYLDTYRPYRNRYISIQKNIQPPSNPCDSPIPLPPTAWPSLPLTSPPVALLPTAAPGFVPWRSVGAAPPGRHIAENDSTGRLQRCWGKPKGLWY